MDPMADNVLVPIDFSDSSLAALRRADQLAVDSGSKLTVLHVHPVTMVTVLDYTYAEPPELVAASLEAVHERLRSIAVELSTPADRVKTDVRTGEPANEIISAAKDHDLLIMGTHGRSGVSRFLMGSVAERVVRGAPCSVLVHREPSA